MPGNLKIEYVQRIRHRPEDLPPDIVEVYIGVSGRTVDLSITRRGFVIADPVMHTITERIENLVAASACSDRPLADRIGLSPKLSSEWRKFLDDLLQQCDSWAFVVPPTAIGVAS